MMSGNEGARRRAPAVLRHLPFALVFASALVSGLIGIDFGGHWDERRMMTTVYNALRDGRVLPAWYNYPSLTFNLVLLSIFEDSAAALARRDEASRRRLQEDLEKKIFDPRYAVRARSLFLVVTLLSVPWLYLLVLRSRGSPAEALIAAALPAASWEVAYHARWIAPDGVLMQFAALFLLVTMIMASSKRRLTLWLGVSAAVAGLACGTKYPGGILLLPALFYAVGTRGEGGGGPVRTIRNVVLVLAVFSVAFFTTTPGAIIETSTFIEDVRFEVRHYGGGHEGYSVLPGLPHAWRMMQYLALNVFSRFWPIALFFFLFVPIGAYRIVRSNQRAAFLVVLVSLLYFLFMSMQKVMLVRNLLFLVPFVAVMSARGVMAVRERLRVPSLKVAFLGVVAAALTVNFVWLFYAAATIRARDRIRHVARVLQYMDQHPNDVVFVSASIRRGIEAVAPERIAQNVTADRALATRFVIDTCDAFERKKWPANRFGQWHMVSGPYEINFDYYPTWGGNCHVVAVGADVASGLGPIRGQLPTPAPDQPPAGEAPERKPTGQQNKGE